MSLAMTTSIPCAAMHWKGALGAVTLAATALISVPAAAQGGGADAWQFEVTPYLWASGMKGSVQAGTLPNTNVNMSFSDIVENLDFGFMGTIEARKDRWGILVDGVYMNVFDSATATRTGPGPAGATLVGYADVGGFGAGSDFTWQALAGLNYAFSRSIAGKFGYRYISVDYDNGGFMYDMKTQGIVVGAGIRF